ncbi:MAG TPA: acyltransferase family protein [Woeseiaceae bacterium]|nr:acyltransferase family protein [Woeseiaceae bacterium]
MKLRIDLSYRPDVQGLRAIAIGLVILAHSHVPGFAGGFIGVDVFFVLSGYLITGLLMNEWLSTGRIRYPRFLARRLRRLLPALLAMIFAVMLLAMLLLSSYEVRMQTGSAVYSATWMSNFFFALSEFDYFNALTAKDLFLHTWSLGVEEQFYLVWPGLISIAMILAANNRRFSVDNGRLVGFLLVIFVCSLAISIRWTQVAPLISFYMMPSRGWQFAMGALVFISRTLSFGTLAKQHPCKSSAGYTEFVGIVGLALIFGSAIVLEPSTKYPGLYALFPTIGAACVIAAGDVARSPVVGPLLRCSPLVWLGDRSYSVYLWHWPIIIFGGSYGFSRGLAGGLMLVAVTLLVSVFSYRFIELPFWKGRYSTPVPLRTLTSSLLAMSILIVAVQGAKLGLDAETGASAGRSNYDPRVDMPAIYKRGMRCDTWYSSAEVEPCFIGANDGKKTAILLGDSIGAQWISLLPEIYASPEWRVAVITKSGCAIVEQEYYYDRVGGTYDTCTEWRRNALEYLRNIRPEVIFVGSSSHYEFTAQEWTDGVQSVLRTLAGATDRIVLVPGTPSLTFNGPSCIESPYEFSFRLKNSERECEQVLESSASADVTAYLAQAASKFKNVEMLDLNDLVCPNGRCAAMASSGIVVFRDERHLTNTFVMAQLEEVSRRLKAMRLDPGSWAEIAHTASTRP